MDYMLGKGGQGAVYRGEFNPTGFKGDCDPSQTIDCASKLLKLTAETRDKTIAEFNQELEVLQAITHPNIVKFYGWGQTGSALYQAIELCPGGDLRGYLANYVGKGIGEKKAWYYFKQIGDALIAFYDKGFIHRDLKPENVLVSEDKKTLYLTDLGLAMKFSANTFAAVKVEENAGTPMYKAPEIYRREVVPTANFDLFSLGVMMYEMITGTFPWPANSEKEL